MVIGKYTQEPFNFKDWECRNPKLTFANNTFNFGCGPNLGNLLTGVSSMKVSLFNKDKSHFSKENMIKFLNLNRIKTHELTVADMSNDKFVTNKLNKNHLLIATQMYSKQNASWVCILNLKYVIHNWVISELDGAELLERPLMSLILCSKKSWK